MYSVFFARIVTYVLIISVAGTGWTSADNASDRRFGPKPLRYSVPVQLTAETDSVLYAEISHDGKWLVYASGPEGSTDLWLRLVDPSAARPPRKLTSDLASEYAPTFSPWALHPPPCRK